MSPLLLLFLGTCGLSSLIFCVVMLLLENRPYLDTVERLVLVPVHPHVRGDNGLLLLSELLDTGTPPRAWGQPSRTRS